MRIAFFLFLFATTGAYSQSITDNLLLDYQFDGNTNDSSPNNYHGTNNGATFVNDRFGNPSGAVYFDGVDDYINFPNISALKPDFPISFSFWIKYDSDDINDRDVFNTSFEEDKNTGVYFNSQASTGNYAINFGDGDNNYTANSRRTYVGDTPIETGIWHHVFIILNSQDDMRIFVDCNDNIGSFSGAGGSLQYSDTPGTLGRHDRLTSEPANYFKGALDDFKYWDRELTEAEIRILCDKTDEPPKITAEGDQFYCPLGAINVVTDFSISGPEDLEIDAFYVQITSGYVNGDLLTLNDNATDLNSSWSPLTGKLTLSKPTGFLSYEEINEAVKNVFYSGTDPEFFGEKFFSFTLGDANYLPSTGHFYEFVASSNIRWDVAKTMAEEMSYFGLPGYLATITSREEAILSGEQATGTGWIGASDQEEEGTWKWVTGPEEGTIFWIGAINGYAPNGEYENWNNNEPNNQGDEDYGHVITNTAIGRKGTWNDLPITGGGGDYAAQGFVVEYGYGDPEDAPDFSAYTRIYTTAIDSIFPGSNCGPGEVFLRAKAIAIDTIPKPALIHWFETETATSPIHTGDTYNPVLDVTTNFYVLAADETCFNGRRTMITASIFDIPDIEKEVTLKNCDQDEDPTDGFTDFNLEEANALIFKEPSSIQNTNNLNKSQRPPDLPIMISYYLSADEAHSATNPLDPFPFNNRTSSSVYARAENIYGCYDIAIVNLDVSATEPVDIVTLESCDLDDTNDGKFAFDLTQATQSILIQLPPQNLVVQYYRNLNDATLELNEILPQTEYTNEDAFYQMLYVRVESEDNGDCISLGEFVELVVYPLPEFDLIQEATYCLNHEPITVSIENPEDNYVYEWRNSSDEIISLEPSVVFSSGGTYSVIATSTENCESIPRTIQINESSIASIGQEDIEVDDGEELNSISINTANLGIGEYEYALDRGAFQDEPFFDNLAPGIYDLNVNDKNACGNTSISVSVIGFSKYFTPNGDRINETWQVLGILSQPASNIFVYDKFGKLLAQIDPRGEGWDGIYNGKQMPSSDYWYMVQLEDGRVYRGHFSLIRR